jgi:hypothetical protein
MCYNPDECGRLTAGLPIGFHPAALPIQNPKFPLNSDSKKQATDRRPAQVNFRASERSVEA